MMMMMVMRTRRISKSSNRKSMKVFELNLPHRAAIPIMMSVVAGSNPRSCPVDGQNPTNQLIWLKKHPSWLAGSYPSTVSILIFSYSPGNAWFETMSPRYSSPRPTSKHNPTITVFGMAWVLPKHCKTVNSKGQEGSLHKKWLDYIPCIYIYTHCEPAFWPPLIVSNDIENQDLQLSAMAVVLRGRRLFLFAPSRSPNTSA